MNGACIPFALSVDLCHSAVTYPPIVGDGDDDHHHGSGQGDAWDCFAVLCHYLDVGGALFHYVLKQIGLEYMRE